MSQQTFDNCPIRVVRDEDAGLYYVQVGVDGVFRNINAFKLGKLDQLRTEKAEAALLQPPPPPPSV